MDLLPYLTFLAFFWPHPKSKSNLNEPHENSWKGMNQDQDRSSLCLFIGLKMSIIIIMGMEWRILGIFG
jgi:hypothetical protein